jgi:hypothetical protein
MDFRLNQHVKKGGFFTEAKFLWGTVRDLEQKIGYHSGRLKNGFFLAYLTRVPELEEFRLGGYSQTQGHKIAGNSDYDNEDLKRLAREKMLSVGNMNLIKIFPNSMHDNTMHDDLQYPVGAGIPQWNLTKELLMFIYKEYPAGYLGTVRAH